MSSNLHPTIASAIAHWMPPPQRAAIEKPWRNAVLTPAPKDESWGDRRARYFDECRAGMDCGPDDDQEGDDFEGAPV